MLYGALLTFIKQRLAYADELLAGPPRRRVDLETCALQIRLALEHLVLSTLVTNRPAAEVVVEAFAKKKASDVRGIIRRINPKYWPIAFDINQDGQATEEPSMMIEPREPFLHEDEWGKAYGYCSQLLHAPNPSIYLSNSPASKAASRGSHNDHVSKLMDYSHKTQRLIKRHQIYLSEEDFSLICHVPDDPHAKPDVRVYERRNPI